MRGLKNNQRLALIPIGTWSIRVAVLLAVAGEVRRPEVSLAMDCDMLVTIFEEVGSGAPSVLHGDMSEILTIDTGPAAPRENIRETCDSVLNRA